MKERLFRFKQFSVSHVRSAMKVGVDGVLIGAWASCGGGRLLDIGCGCGLISLMLAQRNPEANVIGIDIDSFSVEEAKQNVEKSPWGGRISILRKSFAEFSKEFKERKKRETFDAIVSNPPFYDAGVADPSTPREKSRHQGSLSPLSLIEEGAQMLSEGGTLALIAPAEMAPVLTEKGLAVHLLIRRVCYVKDNPSAQVKRVMIEFERRDKGNGCFYNEGNGGCNEGNGGNPLNETFESDRSLLEEPFEAEQLTLFQNPGQPTEEYRRLCKNFYLKF